MGTRLSHAHSLPTNTFPFLGTFYFVKPNFRLSFPISTTRTQIPCNVSVWVVILAEIGISLSLVGVVGSLIKSSNPNAWLQSPGRSSAVATVVPAVPARSEQEQRLGFVEGEQFHGEVGLYSYVGSF